MNFVVSEADFSELQTQINDATAFLEVHRTELLRLVSFPGIEGVSLDFGIEQRDVVFQSDQFPPQLLGLAGTLGIRLEITRYPAAASSADKSSDVAPVISHGTVVNPRLHDGHVLGLVIGRERCIYVPMRSLENQDYCFVLRGVERFRGDDVWEGNIVLDITAETGSGVETEEVAEVLGLVDGFENKPYLEKMMARFASKELLLFRVNPSYGASLACICSGVEVRRDWLPGMADI